MKKIFLLILIVLSKGIIAQIISGKVIDMHSKEPVFGAKILIHLEDKTVVSAETNSNGIFEYSSFTKTLMFVTIASGYSTDTVSFKKFNNNEKVILLIDNPVFICTAGDIKYKDEENNPEYDYKINGQSTINFVDTANRRQGRWILSQNDKYDKKSKYYFGRPMSIGYYKDNIQVGKWLILSPSGKIKRTITY